MVVWVLVIMYFGGQHENLAPIAIDNIETAAACQALGAAMTANLALYSQGKEDDVNGARFHCFGVRKVKP